MNNNYLEEKLAKDGGRPVREKPLPASFPGASVYGMEEIEVLTKVIDKKSPFRYYGPDVQWMVKNFENNFASKIGCNYALGLTSGTAALIVALKALGIGPGDKVIVPAITFLATAGAVIAAGAVPIFADVDESMNIRPSEIERVADKYTKAVITVPILGNPCKMDDIMAITEKLNLKVIEDVAQSCGSKYHGKYSGSFGNIGCFSLQMNKILTTGEGGAITTNDKFLYERAVRYHDHGMFREIEGFLSSDENNTLLGQNYRMSEITGAVAGEQLKKLDNIISKMKKIKYIIKNEINDLEGISFRHIIDEDGESANALLMMTEDKKVAKEYIEALNAENINAASLYNGKPVYLLPQIYNKKTVDKNQFPFNQFDEEIVYEEGMCEYAEKQLPKNICIMLSPNFSINDAEDIIKGIKKVNKYITRR